MTCKGWVEVSQGAKCCCWCESETRARLLVACCLSLARVVVDLLGLGLPSARAFLAFT
jgi:hypothetical protein